MLPETACGHLAGREAGMHRSQWLGFAPNRRRGVDNPSRTYAHAPVIMSKPTLPTVEERGSGGEGFPALGVTRLHHWQQHVRSSAHRVMHAIPRDNPRRLVPVAAAGVEVAIPAGEVAAAHLQADAVAGGEPVARGLEADAQFVDAVRPHPHLMAVALAVAGAQDPFLNVKS